MALPIFGEIERLITEHGSAAILKERIELIRDRYSDLEEKLATALTKNNELTLEKQGFELECFKLKERVSALEAQLTERKAGRLDAVRDSLLQSLVQFTGHIRTTKAAELTSISPQLALFHLTELEKSGLVHGSYYANGEMPEWAISQGGRAYLVSHDLMT